MKYAINQGSIEVIQGDITDQVTDAIVNAANNHFWMGGGVAGAIKRKGGHEIEKEAMMQGPVEIGESVITSSGKLKSKYVIHATVMGQDLHTDEVKIKNATLSALQIAEKNKITSISFPALGTGVGGFSVYHCAKIMITQSIEFLIKSTQVRKIVYVLFDNETFNAFKKELDLQFSSKRH